MLRIEANRDVYIHELFDLVEANNRQNNTIFKPFCMDVQSRLTDIQQLINTLTYAVDGLYRGSSPMPPLASLSVEAEALLNEESL